MTIDVQFIIKNNPNIYRYLRENSYWYKYLNRNPLLIKELDKEMKNKYKLTTKDKVEKISHNLDMISQVLEVFK